MNVSEDYQIAYARLNPTGVFVVTDLDKGQYRPLVQTEPVGIYTMDPNALYADKEYLLGFRPENISLAGMLNIYHLEIGEARITKEPIYYADLDLIVAGVSFKPSVIPTLDTMALPVSLWSLQTVYLYINDIAVVGDESELVQLPISFNINAGTPAGDVFINSDKAFMVVQPGDKLLLDITSGGGGGAGLNLVKGENGSGEHGGDMTLCYIEPETGDVKPIVFIEGGLGGRLSSNAHQIFKPRESKLREFNVGWVNSLIYIENIIHGHRAPMNDIESTEGGIPHTVLSDEDVAAGGKGGYKEDIGYRGEGGFSGGRVVVQVQYRPFPNQVSGPFLILNPKTMVNIFNVVPDKNLKIKKTKTPMIGGKGGLSLSADGTDGQDGTLIVSYYNG